MDGRPGRVDGFAASCARLGTTAGPGALRDAAADLERRWSDRRRGYHDLEHLDEVLDRLALLGAATPAVVLAAWFHDAVYTGRAGADEQGSAALARVVLAGLGAPAAGTRRVADLVTVTAGHRAGADDVEAQALCDADLAVLAAEPGRYARYVAGVRREHAHVPDAAFARGRAALLRDLLARDRLFRTATGHARWEAAARAAVTDELSALDTWT